MPPPRRPQTPPPPFTPPLRPRLSCPQAPSTSSRMTTLGRSPKRYHSQRRRPPPACRAMPPHRPHRSQRLPVLPSVLQEVRHPGAHRHCRAPHRRQHEHADARRRAGAPPAPRPHGFRQRRPSVVRCAVHASRPCRGPAAPAARAQHALRAGPAQRHEPTSRRGACRMLRFGAAKYSIVCFGSGVCRRCGARPWQRELRWLRSRRRLAA